MRKSSWSESTRSSSPLSISHPTPSPTRTYGKSDLRTSTPLRHHLVRNGTRIVKFFLHVSPGEQERRLRERMENPAKRWKISASDITERAHFDDYQRVYEERLDRDVDRLGSLIHGPGRPQAGNAGRGGRHNCRLDQPTGSHVPGDQ